MTDASLRDGLPAARTRNDKKKRDRGDKRRGKNGKKRHR